MVALEGLHSICRRLYLLSGFVNKVSLGFIRCLEFMYSFGDYRVLKKDRPVRVLGERVAQLHALIFVPCLFMRQKCEVKKETK